MTELDILLESHLLDLLKMIMGFGPARAETFKADPWTPWPFP